MLRIAERRLEHASHRATEPTPHDGAAQLGGEDAGVGVPSRVSALVRGEPSPLAVERGMEGGTEVAGQTPSEIE